MAAIAPAIERLAVGPEWPVEHLWPQVARLVQQAALRRRLPLRDAVVLVPYAALIDPLRAAFALQAGWQPRVETTLTLAASLGPADEPAPGQCSADPVLDRLQAAQWLGGEAFSAHAAALRDRSWAASLCAEAAATMTGAAAQQAPGLRQAWWAALLRQLDPPSDGPGALESTLLRATAAWAEAAPVPVTDRLFALQPAAWVVVRIGGADRLAEAVLTHSICGGYLIDLDPPPDDPYAPWADRARPSLRWAEDFESEAMATAGTVLHALAAGDGRVALVALDRALVRRVVALLQRSGVDVADETGWKLSTTAAAGRLLARLRAAAPAATGDDRLDWLKRWPPALAEPLAMMALERLWRGGRNARLEPAARQAAAALWLHADAVLDAWRRPGPQPLAAWLALLLRQLHEDGDWGDLAADTAGARLLQVLQVDDGSAAWRQALRDTRCGLAGFTSWVEALCEALTVQSTPRPGARVVLTPLARALGRPFVHVVLAGVDSRRLDHDRGGSVLIGDGLAGRLGLETAAERRLRRRLALAQLLRVPGLTLLWRRLDGDAPLAPSIEVDGLQTAWMQAGRALPVQPAVFEQHTVPAQPVARPRPTAGDALPQTLSASAVEALRACPYRFFARSVLRLAEQDELDVPLRKRDYGDWLHAALHRFHRSRQPGQDDASALQQAGDEAVRELGLDPAALLAYRASFDALRPEYLHWLARHEAAGWHWLAGEDELLASPPAWAPQRLRGRIDRIDQGTNGARLVLDYKTGAVAGLRDRLKDPQEDSQLPFYVALLQAQGEAGEIQAAYLSLDDRGGPRLLPHDAVQDSATELVAHLAVDLLRLRDGAAMPALGEGSVCDTCEARGLCRRDQWPPTPELRT